MTTDPDFDPSSVPVRPAATVMLLRDVAGALEVFMLRRTPSAAFAASQYVFPGGKVDEADGAGMEHWCDGRDDAAASAVLGLPVGGLGYWVAAIRECFEEAGVLLARHAGSGEVVSFGDPAVAERFEAYRREVHAGRLGLDEVCRREDLRLITDAIGYVSNWVTPVGSPRRFDARFFVAHAPVDQEPLHDDHETVASLWVHPADALARCAAGEFAMFPPTVASLRFLAARPTAAAAMAASTIRPPTMRPAGAGRLRRP